MEPRSEAGERLVNGTAEIVAATLRVVAEQVRDQEDRADLLATADRVEASTYADCCPLCQEVTCDESCPLAPVRKQGEADPSHGLTDAELHERCAHPDWEYRTTKGPRKQWDDADTPPSDAEGDPDPTWERNVDVGRDGWERWDYTEESYWRRRKQ
ncbi:hypothetical protein [Streptomyces sp. NPDC056227]|uniref:hypothetical protein n=1 Tax=Streptomyces sp. NPDC056227 TaxID=3345753 RepID=UPI0035DEE2D0